MKKTNLQFRMIPAGLLKRHPKAQRKANMPAFLKRIGEWDWDKFAVLFVHSDGNGGFHVVSGAHRAEYVQKTFGLRQEVPCMVDMAPRSVEEDAKLFLALDDPKQRYPQKFTDIHRLRVTARQENALLVRSLLSNLTDQRLAYTFYIILEKFSSEVLQKTSRALATLWAKEKSIPPPVASGVARFVSESDARTYAALLSSKVLRRHGDHGAAPFELLWKAVGHKRANPKLTMAECVAAVLRKMCK